MSDDTRTPEEQLAGVREMLTPTDPKPRTPPMSEQSLDPTQALAVLTKQDDPLPSDPYQRTVVYIRAVEAVHDAAAKVGNWQAQLAALKLGIMTILATQRRLEKDRAQKKKPTVDDDGRTIDMSALTDEELATYRMVPPAFPKKSHKRTP